MGKCTMDRKFIYLYLLFFVKVYSQKNETSYYSRSQLQFSSLQTIKSHSSSVQTIKRHSSSVQTIKSHSLSVQTIKNHQSSIPTSQSTSVMSRLKITSKVAIRPSSFTFFSDTTQLHAKYSMLESTFEMVTTPHISTAYIARNSSSKSLKTSIISGMSKNTSKTPSISTSNIATPSFMFNMSSLNATNATINATASFFVPLFSVNFTTLNCSEFNFTGYNETVYNSTWKRKCYVPPVIEGPPWWENRNIYFGAGGFLVLLVKIFILKAICSYLSKFSGEYLLPRHLLPRRKRKREQWCMRHIDVFPTMKLDDT